MKELGDWVIRWLSTQAANQLTCTSTGQW